MSEPLLDQKEAIRIARADGFKIYRGKPRWLLLDLDDDESVAVYEEHLQILQQRLNIKEHRRWTSKSGFGTHVLVKLPAPLPVAQRMLLQAILGSDLKREWYSLLRLWRGNKEPSMLFEPPRPQVKDQRALSDVLPFGRADRYPPYDERIADDDVPF